MTAIDKLLEGFPGATVGVIGDSVADVYLLGRPERISREAPVMVVLREEERLIPGCAANTVNNLVALGCRAAPVTLVGEDPPGRQLKRFFESCNALQEGILSSPDYQTVTKTRIMVGDANRIKHQVIRVDHEPQGHLPDGMAEKLEAAIDRLNPQVDAWLVSDYNYCIVSERVARKFATIAAEKAVVVDSRFQMPLFKGVTCLTPNESEAEAVTGIPIRTREDAVEAGGLLLSRLEAEALLLTRGNRGMMLFERSGSLTEIPVAGKGEVIDVSGAGDTVAAAFTIALVAGGTFREAARLANGAAGVVVTKPGAATCSLDELRTNLTP